MGILSQICKIFKSWYLEKYKLDQHHIWCATNVRRYQMIRQWLNKSAGSFMQSFVEELVQFSPLKQAWLSTAVKQRKCLSVWHCWRRFASSTCDTEWCSSRESRHIQATWVHFAGDLKWTSDIEAISRKVASRLYLLKQLKRSAAGLKRLFFVRDLDAI